MQCQVMNSKEKIGLGMAIVKGLICCFKLAPAPDIASKEKCLWDECSFTKACKNQKM